MGVPAAYNICLIKRRLTSLSWWAICFPPSGRLVSSSPRSSLLYAAGPLRAPRQAFSWRTSKLSKEASVFRPMLLRSLGGCFSVPVDSGRDRVRCFLVPLSKSAFFPVPARPHQLARRWRSSTVVSGVSMYCWLRPFSDLRRQLHPWRRCPSRQWRLQQQLLRPCSCWSWCAPWPWCRFGRGLPNPGSLWPAASLATEPAFAGCHWWRWLALPCLFLRRCKKKVRANGVHYFNCLRATKQGAC